MNRTIICENLKPETAVQFARAAWGTFETKLIRGGSETLIEFDDERAWNVQLCSVDKRGTSNLGSCASGLKVMK